MKKISYLLIIALFLSCSDKEKISQLEKDKQQLQLALDSLNHDTELKNQFIQEYSNTINEVYDNLENIRKREGLIAKYSKDIEKNQNITLRERMLSNLKSIDAYLKSSKAKVQELNAKLNKQRMSYDPLKETVERLNNTIIEKEKYIAELKNQISDLYIEVDAARKEIEAKEEVIQETTKKLNLAYYIIGTKNELKDNGIIEEKGGILGLRKTKKLAPAFDESLFTRVDISSTDKIDLHRKINKIEIISPHNPDSYHLAENGEEQSSIEIIDPQEFWKMKYLVILVKN
jgi:chromosome segregation ATPase